MQTISLKCSNCGANLAIRSDVENLACGHCGASQVVEREGGAIYLRQMAKGISEVTIGTSKTAAELALVRLDQELKDIERRYNAQQLRHDSRRNQNGIPFLIGVGIAIILPAYAGITLQSGWPMVITIPLMGGIGYLWIKSAGELSNKLEAENRALYDEYQIIKKKKAAQKAVVDS
jgi:ribosomal protein S27AE